MGIREIAFALLMIVSTDATAAEQPKLLSTSALARDISALPDVVRSTNDTALANSAVAKVKAEIRRFVTRQIELYPSISKCELQKQLADAFQKSDGTCSSKWPLADTDLPRVFVQPKSIQRGRRVFVVTYCIWLGTYGEGGYETVIESYVWDRDRGVQRKASIAPAGLRIATDTEEVCWFPDTENYWLLVYGTSGTSGRALSGTASVIEVGPKDARLVWSAPPDIGNVTAHAHARDLRWEIKYVNMRRYYDELPHATFLDIYEVIWKTRTHRRLAHITMD